MTTAPTIRFALLLLLAFPAIAGAQPFGNFALQPGQESEGRQISAAQLKLKGVDGLTVRWRRAWPLSFIDGCQSRVKQSGDVWTLLPMGGDSSAPTSEANIREWEQLYKTLGAEYGNDPNLCGFHVSGCTPFKGASEEQHWGKPMPPAAIAGNKRLLKAAATSFPNQTIIFAIAGDDPAAMKQLISYGMTVAPGRFLVKHNAMKASTQISAAQNQLVIYAGQHGAMVGFEMAAASDGGSRVGSLSASIAKANQVAKLAGRPLSYLAVYPPDLSRLGSVK